MSRQKYEPEGYYIDGPEKLHRVENEQEVFLKKLRKSEAKIVARENLLKKVEENYKRGK